MGLIWATNKIKLDWNYHHHEKVEITRAHASVLSNVVCRRTGGKDYEALEMWTYEEFDRRRLCSADPDRNNLIY